MLVAKLPFDGKSLNDLYDRINSGKYVPMQNVSKEVEDLVAQMLCVNSSKRITLQQVKNHPWVNIGYHSVPSNYLPKRASVVRNPNLESLTVLKGVGFTEQEVLRVLRRDNGLHPIVCLYHLAEECRMRKQHQEEAKTAKLDQVQQTAIGIGQLALTRQVTKYLSLYFRNL
jgi:serine/threonine protein kinase